jgi:hypothetical protein
MTHSLTNCLSRLSVGTLFASCLLLAPACKDNTETPPPPADLSVIETGPDLKDFKSDCGHPGDTGNSLGVGKFCIESSDCAENTQATLCTTLGDATNFFCTFACSRTGAPDQCGENAICQCSGGGCGCFPNACLDAPPDAGTDMPPVDMKPAPDMGP